MNKITHGCSEIWNFSSRVQFDISRDGYSDLTLEVFIYNVGISSTDSKGPPILCVIINSTRGNNSSFNNSFRSDRDALENYRFIYACLKRCRVKRVHGGQCDKMELWEDGTGKFVTGYRFLIFKIFSFQDNLKSELRHAELLQCARD